MIYKCKMCGGNLIEDSNNKGIAECENCGTKQTISTIDDEIISNLYNRANNLRLKCEFDKASSIYEKIIETKPDEAEAYFGLVLCKYGIEYVDDPKTNTKIPTCHRTLFESILTDPDFEAAIDYANPSQEAYYKQEARRIDHIQKDILNIVKNEKPFDVFICYKETDENGKRTVDSAIANDIYYELTKEGFKVFYAAITLEDKLGEEYEPYIFAALNSAKVMLVIGTKPEYFNAVWVKNEWSRFLKLMKTDKSKHLFPCYRDMNPYDLPEEFSHLQAQDMSKIGFINDITRGIKKILDTEEKEDKKDNTQSNDATDTLLRRAQLFIEDNDVNNANAYIEKALDINPECATAYLYKLLIDLKLRKKEDLANYIYFFDNNPNYQKALRFGDEKLVSELKTYASNVENNRNHNVELCANSIKNVIYRLHSCKLIIYDRILSSAGFGSFETIEDLEECKKKINIKLSELYDKKRKTGLFAFSETSRIVEEIENTEYYLKICDIATNLIKEVDSLNHSFTSETLDSSFLDRNPELKVIYNKKYPDLDKKYNESTYMFLGSYVQNSRDKEPILWRIVDFYNNCMMLVSEHALEKAKFDETIKYNKKNNTISKPSSWQESTIRKKLNTVFINEAFNEHEQKVITEPLIKDCGKPTLKGDDLVFLLSVDEINHFMRAKGEKICKGTIYSANDICNVSWFTRSPGSDDDVCVVGFDEKIYYGGEKGFNITDEYYVRPCIWVDANSVIK